MGERAITHACTKSEERVSITDRFIPGERAIPADEYHGFRTSHTGEVYRMEVSEPQSVICTKKPERYTRHQVTDVLVST